MFAPGKRWGNIRKSTAICYAITRKVDLNCRETAGLDRSGGVLAGRINHFGGKHAFGVNAVAEVVGNSLGRYAESGCVVALQAGDFNTADDRRGDDGI